ncbi:MAG: GAF domain-containing protein [Anaerolineaceae bacterium]|nr:GAF domain-containing protein [Anaerolineaceae bacterium]
MEGLGFIAIVSGAVILVGLFLWVRQRQSLGVLPVETENTPEWELASHDDAVLVSSEHGQLIYVNPRARKWLGMNGGNPNLEYIARMANPADNFLELFTGEGQAAFQLGTRWVEASSHNIPTGNDQRMVVVMRELATNTGHSDALNLSEAIVIINEIGETVNASMGVEQVLQALLSIVMRAAPADAGEICLWETSRQFLTPRGWVGDTGYLLSLTEQGGGYRIGEGISGWIARYKKPVLVPHVGDHNAIAPKLSGHFVSYVAVPLILGERFIGTFELASQESGRFTQADLALLQAISKQIATSIYNAELYHDQIQRASDMVSLQELAQQESMGSDAVPIYRALSERIAQLIGAEFCGFLLYDENRETLIPALPFYGMDDHVAQSFVIPVPSDSPQRDIWENQLYWVSNDVEDEALVAALGLLPLFSVTGITNLALVPMEVGNQRIGMIQISGKRTEGGFTSRDVKDMLVLAAQAAIVVENIRLYQRERRRESELMGLQEITHAIGALSHEGEFYSNINDRIAHLMGLNICGILLFDKDASQLVIQPPVYGLPVERVAQYRIILHPGSVLGEFWQTGDYWYTNHASTEAAIFEVGLDDFVEQVGVEKTLLAILSAGGRRIGVIQVANKISGEDFEDKDARLLLIFATQVASMIENARLYREVQRRVQEAEGLRKIAEHAGSVLTTDDSFAPILSEIASLVESPLVFINVLDHQTGSLVTYPRWVYGVELHEPLVQDIFAKGFDYSVAVSQNPFITNDVIADSRVIESYRYIARRIGVRRSVIVPLIVGDRSLGELGIANRDYDYTEADIETLEGVASQIATTIERLNLYQSAGQNLNRRLQELDAISNVSNELTQRLDLDPVLDVIRHEAARATQADGSTIVLLRPRASWSQPDQPEIERRLGDETVSRGLADIEREAILVGAEAVLVSDYLNNPMESPSSTIRSGAAAAFLFEDDVVGVIHLHHTRPNTFDERASVFLMALAVKASLGYGNYRRYTEQIERSDRLRRRVEQLNSIFELGQMLHTNVDQVTLLEAIAHSIQHSVGFDTIVISLVDEGARLLRRVAQAGQPLDVFEHSKDHIIGLDELEDLLAGVEKISESFFFPVEAVRHFPARIRDGLSTQYEGNRTLPQTDDFRKWHDGDMLLVPLLGAGGNLLGIMSLDRPHGDQRPERSAVEVLEIFAHQAASTIENMRLYLASLQNVEQEARLNDMMEAITRTLDISEVTQAIATNVLLIVPFNRMTLALEDAQGNGFDINRITVFEEGGLDIRQEHRSQIDQTSLAKAHISGQDALYYAEDTADTAYDDLKGWRDQGEQTTLVVPLQAGGNSLGALHLGSDQRQDEYFKEYRSLVRRVASLSAVAIQNARLFQRTLNLQYFNESVVASIGQGIVVLDPSGRIRSVNRYMQERYHWNSGDALQNDLFRYSPQLVGILKDDVLHVLSTGEPREKLNQLVVYEGVGEFIDNFYIYPLGGADAIQGAVLLIEDVTERSRLEHDIEARANQLAALTEVSSRITASLNREDVIDLAVEEIGRVLSYDTMTLWSRSGDNLVLEGFKGFNEQTATAEDERVRIPVASHDRLKKVMETRNVFAISNLEGRDPLPGEKEHKSWMGIPLVNQYNVVGMIALTKAEPSFYDDIQAQQAGFAFANQVAVALANADLYTEAEYRTERLSLLNRVSVSLAQSLDSENILEIALREIAQTLNIPQARAIIFERDHHLGRVIVQFPRGDAPPSEVINLLESAAARYIRRTAKSLIYENIAELPEDDVIKQELTPRGIITYGLIPMTVGGQVIGAFELETNVGFRRFNEEQIELGQIIANQAAIAVQNTNLLEQTLVRSHELETLLEAAQATSLSLNLEDVYHSVAALIQQALNMDDCSIMLWDNVENVLTVETDQPRNPEQVSNLPVQYNLREYPARLRTMENREILAVQAGDNGGDAKEQAVLAERGNRLQALIPLIVHDQSIGLIQVGTNDPGRSFGYQESRIAQALSAQAAIAIQNARLSTETAALVEESFIINNLSQAISSTLEMDKMIAIIREQIPRVTDADELYLALYDGETEHITFPLAVADGKTYEISPRELNTDEVSFIIRHRRSLTLGGGNWDANEMRRNLGITNGEGDVKSYLGVPVVAGDQVMGVLALRDSHRNRTFGMNDERLLTTVGTQLGAAIQNARLFRQISSFADELHLRVQERTAELQKERDRIDTLYHITSDLARTLDLDRVLARALEMVAQAVNADDGTVMLIDPMTDQLFPRTTLHGDAKQYLRKLHPAQKLAEWLIENDNYVVVDDLHQKPYWDESDPDAQQYRSALAVQLETNDDVQGVIVLLSSTSGVFTESQIKLVVAAANQIASSMSNAELYHLIRDQAERLGTLLRAEQEEAEKNTAILDSIADGVMLADSDGVIVLFNPAAQRILDLPRDHALGQTLQRLTGLFGSSANIWANTINAWQNNPQQHPEGSFLEERLELGKKVVSVHLSPVHNAGRFLGTVSVFRDITKEVEVDQIKSQFVSNVSHELRTPMTSIKGFADLLLMGVAGDIPEAQKSFLVKIKTNADRLSHLVDDLLNISKIDAGERLNLDLIDIEDVLNPVLAGLRNRVEHEDKPLDVTMEIEPQLAPLQVDTHKLTQILTNLTDNAFNYTYAGGKIAIKAWSEDDNVIISIADTGIGIPPEFRPRIWERFERFEDHALVMDVAGTGLGLPIVKQLVEMHHGEVWFESEQGKGTTFFIRLPFEQPAQEAIEY